MKFLFFPGPAHGHVNPMLPLVRELRGRGDDVVFFVPQEFEGVVRAAGASVRLLDNAIHLPTTASGAGGTPSLQAMMPQMLGMMTRGLKLAPQLAEQARAEHADAVVYDPMAMWGRAVAVMLRLPTAIFQTSFVMSAPTLRRQMQKNFKKRAFLGVLLPILKLQWASRMLAWRHGVPHLGMRALFAATEGLNLVPIPRRYQPDGDSFDERYLFMGPAVESRGDRGDFPMEKLEGRPVLFISLGTTPMNQRPDFYQACFEAFRDTPWQVVMACGKHLEPAALGPIPANFLVRQSVPQLDVLAHARVFITHGGMNSTMEGLWHGVPLAFFPQFGDQPINAQRVTELGMGVTLTAQDALDPKVLRATVERLDTDPGYRAKVSVFQQELRNSGGPVRAADALRQFVTRP